MASTGDPLIRPCPHCGEPLRAWKEGPGLPSARCPKCCNLVRGTECICQHKHPVGAPTGRWAPAHLDSRAERYAHPLCLSQHKTPAVGFVNSKGECVRGPWAGPCEELQGLVERRRRRTRRFEQRVVIALSCWELPKCGGRIMVLVGNMSLREAGARCTTLAYECKSCLRRVAVTDEWPRSTPESDALHDVEP